MKSKAPLLRDGVFFMDTPLWGVRVQAPFGARVQKVQRVQRVEVGASNYGRRPLIIKPLQPPCGRWKCIPPLVAGATTLPGGKHVTGFAGRGAPL